MPELTHGPGCQYYAHTWTAQLGGSQFPGDLLQMFWGEPYSKEIMTLRSGDLFRRARDPVRSGWRDSWRRAPESPTVTPMSMREGSICTSCQAAYNPWFMLPFCAVEPPTAPATVRRAWVAQQVEVTLVA